MKFFKMNQLTVLSFIGAIALSFGSAQAAIITTSTSTPVASGDDIAQLTGTSGGTFDVGKWWTDTSDPGQTFTTGSDTNGYELNSLSLYMIWPPSGTYGQTIRVSTIAGTTLTPFYSETGTLPPAQALSSAGYVTWTFDTPVSLSANTDYAIDVTMNSASGTILGVGWASGNPYTGGGKYTVNDSATTVSVDTDKDYNFLLDINNVIPELTWDGGDGNWTADHWTVGGSSSQPWEPDANVTFNSSLTNPEKVTLVGGVSANDVTFSGAGPYVIQDNPADDGVTGVDSLTIGGTTTIASGVKVAVTAITVNTADVAVDGTLVVDGGLNSSGTITVGATGTIGGDGTISAANFVFDAEAEFWVDPNGTLDFGTTSVDFSGLTLGKLANADSLAPGTYVLAIGDNLGLEAYSVGETWGNGTLSNGREAYFQKGSLELVIIPEPSTIILAGLGLMGVTFRRRRR